MGSHIIDMYLELRKLTKNVGYGFYWYGYFEQWSNN